MLEQQLLAAESQGAALAGLSAARSMTSITEASSGSDGAGASIPTRDAARSSRRRIGHQSPTSAVAAPSAQPLRSDSRQGLKRMPRGDQARFGFGRAGRARHRSDRGGQPHEVETLALEGFRGAAQPILASPVGQR